VDNARVGRPFARSDLAGLTGLAPCGQSRAAMGRRLSILDTLNLGFLGVLMVLLGAVFGQTPHQWNTLSVYVGLAALVVVLAALRRRGWFGAWRNVVWMLYPVVFLFVVFESFWMILPYVNGRRFDEELAAMDRAMFGVYPTVWIEQFTSPLGMDLMSLCYVLYFPLPLVPLVWLYRAGQWARLERALLSFLVCYYGGYLGYFAVPAEGPRRHPQIAAMHSGPIEGLVLTRPINALIDVLEPNKLDTFPSLHAGVLLTTMLAAGMVGRRMFWGLVPLAVAILISLVYCRYHYVIDIIVGLAWAAGAWVLAGAMYDRWSPRFAPHFAPARLAGATA
jgi:membrane-associated phospholipid phosphatase